MSKSLFLFTPSLRFGGAEKALVTLANCLKSNSYNVTYCYGKSGELEKDLQSDIVKVNMESPRMIFSILPLLKALAKSKPDVVITTMVHSNIILLLISFFYNLFAKKRVEVIVRETTNIALELEQMSYVKRWVFMWLMRICYPRAKAVVFPNKTLMANFNAHFDLAKDNGVVIYNSSSYFPCDAKDIREVNIENDRKITLLSVGRLTKTKRIRDLLYATKEFSTNLDIKLEIDVDIIGTGPDEENLIELAKHLNIDDVVNFKGFISQPFASYYKKNTIFVLTSELEGMPNALIEALASSLPCISTNCKFGPEEIFEIFDVSKHWLYTSGDTKELSILLLDIINSNTKYKINLKKGSEELSPEKLLLRYKQIIE